jgi:hypothetical protein
MSAALSAIIAFISHSLGLKAQEPVGFTAKRLQDSAQGGGFAEPWVSVTKIACSEGAKDPLQAPGYRAVQVHKK